MKIIKWNADKILKKPARVLANYGPVISEETHRQMATVQFDWGYDTLRFTSLLMGGIPNPKGGVIVYAGKRDAVDRGRLMDSITQPQVTTNAGASVLLIKWLAPYAAKVLYGGVYGEYVNPEGDTVDVGLRPGRDWITPALKQQPLLPYFVQQWRALQ